jgi:DNA-binding FrmR family transcriptional regulator
MKTQINRLNRVNKQIAGIENAIDQARISRDLTEAQKLEAITLLRAKLRKAINLKCLILDTLRRAVDAENAEMNYQLREISLWNYQ